jgi:ankyrin repeat protein
MQRYNDKPWSYSPSKPPKKIDQDLLNACYFNNYRKSLKFLEMGADPNYMEERDGWRPIHYSSRWGNLPMTLLLLKYGANIDGLTNSKETALHKCARWDRTDLAKRLVAMGANIHIKNSDGCKAKDMTLDAELKRILSDTYT